MKKAIVLLITACFCVAIVGCGHKVIISNTEASSTPSSEATMETQEVWQPIAPDLTMDAERNLDGMTYSYGTTWTETSDPLTSATTRTYDFDFGSQGQATLTLVSVNDPGTAGAVENLRTMNDAEREATITSMIAAKEGTLNNAVSERAPTPPAGTRAMWSYQGTTKDEAPLNVHGYSYVGGSQLYEVSVTASSEEAYAALEPTLTALVNRLAFPEIAPIETPSPTPHPTPVPTVQSAPRPASNPTVEAASGSRPVPGWYPSTWSGDDWEGDTLTITVSATTLGDNYASYDIYGSWDGSSGESYIRAIGEYEGAYVSYSGSIEYPDGTSHSISGRLIPTNKHSMSFTGDIEGRNLDPVELQN